MVSVVFGMVGWTTKQQQDDVWNAVDSGKAGKAQFTPGENDKTPVGDSPFGNIFRVELSAATDADATWQQLKSYLAAHPPVHGSRIRRLECSWDDANVQVCSIVQELIWQLDGSVTTRP
jgi:hypothetical protein